MAVWAIETSKSVLEEAKAGITPVEVKFDKHMAAESLITIQAIIGRGISARYR